MRGPTGFIRAQPSYIGDAGWSSWHGRCNPEGKGSIIGRKRGIFDHLFGKPAEKTRPIEQTQKGPPRNFPPVPTRPPGAETERFRQVPLPPVLENPGLPGPGISEPVLRRLAGHIPGPDGIPARLNKRENSLKCRKWASFRPAKAGAGSDSPC